MFLLSAAALRLDALGVLDAHDWLPRLLVCGLVLAHAAEWPFGKYLRRRAPAPR